MSEWIKCSERLPEESGMYLTYNKYDIMNAYFYSKKYNAWNFHDWMDQNWLNELEIRSITHWMPLPKAPHLT